MMKIIFQTSFIKYLFVFFLFTIPLFAEDENAQYFKQLNDLIANYEFDQALKVSDEWISKYPKESKPYECKIELLNHLKRFNKALAVCDEASKYMPGDYDITENKGTIELFMGNNPQAIDTLLNVLKSIRML